MRRHTAYVEDEHIAWLREQAYQHELTESHIVRLALDRLRSDPQVDQLLDQLRQQGRGQ